jgi:hypothetical protein
MKLKIVVKLMVGMIQGRFSSEQKRLVIRLVKSKKYIGLSH